MGVGIFSVHNVWTIYRADIQVAFKRGGLQSDCRAAEITAWKKQAKQLHPWRENVRAEGLLLSSEPIWADPAHADVGSVLLAVFACCAPPRVTHVCGFHDNHSV